MCHVAFLLTISGIKTYTNLKRNTPQQYLSVCLVYQNFTQFPMKCILFTMSGREITTKQFKCYVHSNWLWLKRVGKRFSIQLYFFNFSKTKYNYISYIKTPVFWYISLVFKLKNRLKFI